MRRSFDSPLLPPTLLLLFFLCLAPAMGEVRDLIFRLAPGGSAVKILGAALAALGVAGAAFFFFQIRERRRFRYGALVFAGILLWLQIVGFGTGQASTDVVEKVHIFQYGLIGFLLSRARRPLDHLAAVLWVLGAAALAGTLEEFVQWFAPRRTGEIRDVAINVAAGWTGLVLFFAWSPPESWSWTSSPQAWRAARRAAATAILVAGVFFSFAHLGHEIEDPRVGRFKSWHTEEELLAADAERNRLWAKAPPKTLPVWGKEDYYLTEAAWHANHRNASRRAGDPVSAWNANRILELYYSAFLDLPSFRGSGVHRYPAKVRKQLKRQAGRPDLSGRISPVLAERIYTRPSKPIFLGAVFFLAAILWLWPFKAPPESPTDPETPA